MVEIKQLITQEEGKTLEFKESLKSPKNILKTIVAFANTAGGVLVIGVEDKSKAVLGIKNAQDEEERLSNLIMEHIRPQIRPEIEFHSVHKKTVLIVIVSSSPMRPYYIRKEGDQKGVYIRVGSTNRLASPEYIEELKRFTRREPFDTLPALDYKISDIDLEAAKTMLGPHRKWNDERAPTLLRLTTNDAGKKRPTNGGILLFGKEREYAFPGAWFQCGRFAGKSKSEVIDHIEVHDHLPQLPDRVLDFVKKHAFQTSMFEGEAKRKDRWSIPIVGLREAVINAVVHADYSQHSHPLRLSFFDNSIVIENPGLLIPGLSFEDLDRGASSPRNSVITRVFRELKLIEYWGSGIRRMREDCERLGLPTPIFEEVGNSFRVTFNLIQKSEPSLSNIELNLLKLLRYEPKGVAPNILARELGFSERYTRSRLKDLLSKGLVAATGTGPRDPHRKYILVD